MPPPPVRPLSDASLRIACGRADVDAGGAADLLVAAVGADLLLVVEELRLLELADASRAARSTASISARVVGGMEIALRRLVQRDLRRGAEVEHEVEGLGRRPAASRWKSIAPAASQTRTQSRWPLHFARSIW